MNTTKSNIPIIVLTGLLFIWNCSLFGHDLPTGSPQIRQINFTEFAMKYNTTDSKHKTYQFREAFEVVIPFDQEIEINVLFPANVQKKNELLKLFRWDSSKSTWIFEKNIKIGKETVDGQNFRSIAFSKSGIYAVFEDFKSNGETCIHTCFGRKLITGSVVQENIRVKVSHDAVHPNQKLRLATNSLSVLSEITLKIQKSKKDNPVELQFKMGELKSWQVRETKKGDIHIFLRKKDIERFIKEINAS
jgi:hypothetical protein